MVYKCYVDRDVRQSCREVVEHIVSSCCLEMLRKTVTFQLVYAIPLFKRGAFGV
jgi:hypothetical protein